MDGFPERVLISKTFKSGPMSPRSAVFPSYKERRVTCPWSPSSRAAGQVHQPQQRTSDFPLEPLLDGEIPTAAQSHLPCSSCVGLTISGTFASLCDQGRLEPFSSRFLACVMAQVACGRCLRAFCIYVAPLSSPGQSGQAVIPLARPSYCRNL